MLRKLRATCLTLSLCTSLATVAAPALAGANFDVNGDGKFDAVNVDWIPKGLATGHIRYDFNGDGVVDLKDWQATVHHVLLLCANLVCSSTSTQTAPPTQ